jgi:hypothetical protein
MPKGNVMEGWWKGKKSSFLECFSFSWTFDVFRRDKTSPLEHESQNNQKMYEQNYSCPQPHHQPQIGYQNGNQKIHRGFSNSNVNNERSKRLPCGVQSVDTSARHSPLAAIKF